MYALQHSLGRKCDCKAEGGAIWVALPSLSLDVCVNAASCWGGAPLEPVCIRVQVEWAFDALSERAQGEILKAAQSQAEHRTDALLQAVDMDRFVRGTPESCTPCRPGSSKQSCV